MKGERTLGAYHLLLPIGAGGFGRVYLARRAGLERYVAVKVLHDHLVGLEDATARFVDEVRVHSMLSHPNIASLIDGGIEDGVPYLAMEYLRGETLATLHRALPRAEAAWSPRMRWGAIGRILSDAARGLHAAHVATDPAGRRLEMVHRDVCPSNAFVLYTGITQVADFGIAISADRIAHTASGGFRGHIAYAAPEHASGQRIGPAADTWSLGVVGWELCTAQHLFGRATDVETWTAVMRADVPVPADEVPRALWEILRRCLHRDPAARWPSLADMADAIDDWLEDARLPSSHAAVARAMSALFPEGAGRHDERVRALHGRIEGAHAEGASRTPASEHAATADHRVATVHAADPVADATPATAIVAAAAAPIEDAGRVRPSAPPSPREASGSTETAPLDARPLVVVETPERRPARMRVAPLARVALLLALLVVAVVVVGSQEGAIDDARDAASPWLERFASGLGGRATPSEDGGPSEAADGTPRAQRIARHGELEVRVPRGSAEVIVDGRDRCQTPCRRSLLEGPHRVEIQFEDGERRTRRVAVRAGRITRIVEHP